MTTPKYCECGRKILVLINRRLNPKARVRGLAHGRTLKDHDMCADCWRRITHAGVRGA